MDQQNILHSGAPHVHATIGIVDQELRQLMQRRAELTERIGTIRRTLAGLYRLFSEQLPRELEEYAHQNPMLVDGTEPRT